MNSRANINSDLALDGPIASADDYDSNELTAFRAGSESRTTEAHK